MEKGVHRKLLSLLFTRESLETAGGMKVEARIVWMVVGRLHNGLETTSSPLLKSCVLFVCVLAL